MLAVWFCWSFLPCFPYLHCMPAWRSFKPSPRKDRMATVLRWTGLCVADQKSGSTRFVLFSPSPLASTLSIPALSRAVWLFLPHLLPRFLHRFGRTTKITKPLAVQNGSATVAPSGGDHENFEKSSIARTIWSAVKLTVSIAFLLLISYVRIQNLVCRCTNVTPLSIPWSRSSLDSVDVRLCLFGRQFPSSLFAVFLWTIWPVYWWLDAMASTRMMAKSRNRRKSQVQLQPIAPTVARPTGQVGWTLSTVGTCVLSPCVLYWLFVLPICVNKEMKRQVGLEL